MFVCNAMAATVFAVGRRIAAACERRRARKALFAMDDYMLKDMGISRSDIDRISHRSRPPL